MKRRRILILAVIIGALVIMLAGFVKITAKTEIIDEIKIINNETKN
jgi:uncharacterized integral membrane protein